MAKVQQKSEKISAFGGIFFVLDRFDRILSSVIDSHLGLRSKLIGYQYSEIIRAVFSVDPYSTLKTIPQGVVFYARKFCSIKNNAYLCTQVVSHGSPCAYSFSYTSPFVRIVTTQH